MRWHLKKRDFILATFIILAVITAIAVIREHEAIDVKVGLQEDNDKFNGTGFRL
jgi:hypothetical protein